MPTPTFTTDWADENPLTEDILDDFSSSIVSFFTTTRLADDNIQTGGIATANLATGCVTAAKIGASAVETAKINDLAVTTGKINDLAVTTGKIAANAVTRAKLESVGQQVSSDSNSFTTTSTSYTDVTNMAATITTTGRPVIICAYPSSDDGQNLIGSGGNSSGSCRIKLVRDSTDLAIWGIASTITTYSSLLALDAPSSGTYVYKIQVKSDGSGQNMNAVNMKLAVYEL